MATERTTTERRKTETGAAALRRRVAELSAMLREAEAALSAIRGGEVDEDVVSTPAGNDVRTLQGGERAFRVILEDIGEGAVTLTQEGLILYANRRFAEIVGVPSEQVIGSAIFRFLSPSDGDVLRESLASAMAARVRTEAAVASQRGSVPTLFSLTALPGSEPPAICMVATDLTELLRMESRLRISEERFRQLFLQNEEPQFLFRGGSIEILDVNPAAVQLYGYPREELLRIGLSLFVPPTELPELTSAISGIGFDTILSIERATHHRRDGEQIIVSLRGKSICVEGGHVAFCSFRDITGRVQMEEEAKIHQAQLIHANRMASLGTIVSSVAHEVNNPNNLIMFNAPMIVSAWDDAVPVLEAYFRENGDFSLGGLPYSEMREVVPRLARGISDASLRIKGIVGNLKDFARQDGAKEHAPVQMNDVVRTAVAILNHEIIKATHRFEMKLDEDLPPVSGSSQELEQVIINLMNNALQALPSNQRGVRVSTRLAPGTREVEVCVADEGVGMAPEVLERIKAPFFSTRIDSGGLGLGVSICRSIVQKHKGTLKFESEDGKGTRAVVRLPGIDDRNGNDAETVASKIR
jgi:PAS domain S-box-containing protein